MLSEDTTEWKRPVTLMGEVLYDCLPHGQVLGGAPFNVAWNLQGFGIKPFLNSAIGNDKEGYDALKAIKDWGMNATGIQVLDDYPTGRVEVVLCEGKPSYDIVPDQAYDHIRYIDAMLEHAKGILYHGSLIFRCEESASVLNKLKAAWKGSVFVDINIRKPWFDERKLENNLEGVTWLKLSDEELPDLIGETFLRSAVKAQMGKVRERFGIDNVILTCGGHGAYWCGAYDELLYQAAPEGITIKDTVGAGDAFTSVCLLGILKRWSRKEILANAAAFAGKVCSLSGATTQDKQFYTITRELK